MNFIEIDIINNILAENKMSKIKDYNDIKTISKNQDKCEKIIDTLYENINNSTITYKLIENFISTIFKLNKENYSYLLISNLTEEFQNENIKYLSESFEYENSKFIMPRHKGNWENAAKVLQMRGYPRIKDILLEMFEWLQDYNWPGSKIIFDILVKLPKDIFLSNLELTITAAKKDNDMEWLYWLRELMLAAQINKKDFSNKELCDILTESDI